MSRRRLVVQQSFPDPRPTTNPYIIMLSAAIRAQPDAELRTFTWRNALLRRYDVFHAHWPEILVEGRTPARAVLRQLLTACLLVRISLLRTPVIRTVHNVDLPDGLDSRQRFLLAWFDRRTRLRIILNEHTPVPPGSPAVNIAHGHYRDWFAEYPRSAPVDGRLGYFGLIRRYKNVQALVSAFHGTPATMSLRVGGRPSTPELASELEGLAADDDRIELHLEFLTDEELVAIATAAQLVVLPYREMHNSGGALAALSLDRPVLVPDNEVNRALAAEVGDRWVRRYSGALSTETLTRTLADVQREPPPGRPDLSGREWTAVGAEHMSAYRRAMERTVDGEKAPSSAQPRRYSW